MIKLRILEKVMQVVTTVSKAIRTVKDKVHKITKAIESNLKNVKERKAVSKAEGIEASLETQVVKDKSLMSKAKWFKQMAYIVKEGNIIYLVSNIQKQRLGPLGGKVVYIDFDYKKEHVYKSIVGYKTQGHIQTRSREPTHSSYGFIV